MIDPTRDTGHHDTCPKHKALRAHHPADLYACICAELDADWAEVASEWSGDHDQ